MSETSYKVLKTGLIAAYRGERQLSEVLLNETVPFAQRKALRLSLDRDVFRATLSVFGADWVPADYNELYESKKLIKQLAADNVVRLAVLVVPFVQQGYLKATPATTVLKRLKDVLMRKRFTPLPRNSYGCYYCPPERPKTDVNNFWSTYADKPVLTEAGWRFLCRLSTSVLRELTVRPWQLRDMLDIFNRLPVAGIETATKLEFEGLQRLVSMFRDDEASLQPVLWAWKRAPSRGNTDFYEASAFYRQTDVVVDWLQDAKPTILAGATWQSMLTRALDWAATKAQIESANVEDLAWPAVIAPFVANDGLVVTPLTSGVQLLEEGKQMKNCLAYMRQYAENGVKGLSQVFRVEGVAGRATVQFVRRHGQPWKLSQAQEAEHQPISKATLRRAIEQLQKRMEGSAWAHEAQ